jgi:hypothetical protein
MNKKGFALRIFDKRIRIAPKALGRAVARGAERSQPPRRTNRIGRYVELRLRRTKPKMGVLGNM